MHIKMLMETIWNSALAEAAPGQHLPHSLVQVVYTLIRNLLIRYNMIFHCQVLLFAGVQAKTFLILVHCIMMIFVLLLRF